MKSVHWPQHLFLWFPSPAKSEENASSKHFLPSFGHRNRRGAFRVLSLVIVSRPLHRLSCSHDSVIKRAIRAKGNSVCRYRCWLFDILSAGHSICVIPTFNGGGGTRIKVDIFNRHQSTLSVMHRDLHLVFFVLTCFFTKWRVSFSTACMLQWSDWHVRHDQRVNAWQSLLHLPASLGYRDVYRCFFFVDETRLPCSYDVAFSCCFQCLPCSTPLHLHHGPYAYLAPTHAAGKWGVSTVLPRSRPTWELWSSSGKLCPLLGSKGNSDWSGDVTNWSGHAAVKTMFSTYDAST